MRRILFLNTAVCAARCAMAGLFAFMMVGCATIRVESKREQFEGKEIRGTERFELSLSGVKREPAQTEELIRLVPESVTRRYQVEKWDRTWNEVTRKRFVTVLGVHSNYSFVSDILVEPILCTIVAIVGPIPLVTDKNFTFAEYFGGVIAILPFINYCGADHPPAPETVVKNREERLVTPVSKEEPVPDERINGRRLDWRIEQADGSAVGSGRVEWPGEISLPWCNWVLKHPTDPLFRLKIASEDVDLQGTQTFDIPVDLADAVRRRWPDAASRPNCKLKIEPVELLDARGNVVTSLVAGDKARLRVRILNGRMGSATAYLVQLGVKGVQPPVSSKAMKPVQVLDCGDAVEVDVPLQLTVDAPDGEIKLQLTATDLLGRSAPSQDYNLQYKHTDLPTLKVFSATISPVAAGQGGATHEMEICVRNAGAGLARDVCVEISSLPVGVDIREKKAVVDEIKSLQRQTLRMPLHIRGDQGSLPVKFRLTESLGLPAVVVDVDVPVLDESP